MEMHIRKDGKKDKNGLQQLTPIFAYKDAADFWANKSKFSSPYSAASRARNRSANILGREDVARGRFLTGYPSG